MKKIIERLKSPVVWISVISQVALIVAIFLGAPYIKSAYFKKHKKGKVSA